MDSNHVYSSSLKRMLGFKLFPSINPEDMTISQPKTKSNKGLGDFVQLKKTDKQIEKMKKEIHETRKKQQQFEKEIDSIVGHMVDEGFAKVVSKKIRRHGSTHKLRIVTEPIEEKSLSKSKGKDNKRILEERQRNQPKNQEASEENEKERWKISTKLPQIRQQASYKKLRSYRLKTEANLNLKVENEPGIYDAENADKLIKHYRAGMSSLKKLKIKPLP